MTEVEREVAGVRAAQDLEPRTRDPRAIQRVAALVHATVPDQRPVVAGRSTPMPTSSAAAADDEPAERNIRHAAELVG